MILMRTLRNDYAKYAREDDDLETLVLFSIRLLFHKENAALTVFGNSIQLMQGMRVNLLVRI